MLDWLPINDILILATSEPDAMDMLVHDHESVKGLFDRFKKAGDRRTKVRIAREALTELKIHAVLEEEIFYPAVRQRVGMDVMNEADEEHHVAKVLIAELEDMDGREDHYNAKFTVLAENVRHHIQEEESEMLPKAQGLDIDFHKLGREMLRRKESLLANGFPIAAEEQIVRASHGRGDSPPKAARKKPTKARRRARI